MGDKIIAIVGESGSGKTTVCELLAKQGYNYIESYTDRPQRYESERGHIFIPTEEVGRYKNEMIAYTYFDNHHYFATREQYKGKGVSIYIIDTDGIDVLKKKINDAEIQIIYLKTDEEIRYKRMCKSRTEESAKERIEHDKKAFEIVECNYVVDNNGNINDTLKRVKKIILVQDKEEYNNIPFASKVKVIKILDTEEAGHLINLIGIEGYIVGKITYKGVVRYKVLFDNNETAYFRYNELEVIE